MESFTTELPAVLSVLKGNKYGLLALGLLVIATVSVLLLKNTPLLARMVAVLLVFGACAGVALSVYSDGRSEHLSLIHI